MTAPITPDERAAMRERARNLRDLALNAEATPTERAYSTDVPRLLDALDTAEREAMLLREDVAEVRAALAEAQTKIVRQRDRLASSRAKVKRQAAEVTRLLAERTAAHADDATCASCTHEYVADMEKRVEEAEAEVARLRAATSPAWDEDSARCCTGDASQDDGHHKSCRYVHGDLRPDPDDRETLADAVLDLWPGRSEAVVKAEGLREAARAVENDERDGSPSVRELVGSIDRALSVEAWLRARADRIEKGETR